MLDRTLRSQPCFHALVQMSRPNRGTVEAGTESTPQLAGRALFNREKAGIRTPRTRQ